MSDESENYIIEATNGGQAMVSKQDWLFLVGYSWSLHGGYLQCNNRCAFNGHPIHGKRIHWFVAQLMGLKIPKGYQIDHINRNRLDNRRSNLRAASLILQAQNHRVQKNNKSGYTGVQFHSRDKEWVANIKIDGKYKHLGYFKTPEEASKVYQAAKKERDEKEIQKCLNKSQQ